MPEDKVAENVPQIHQLNLSDDEMVLIALCCSAGLRSVSGDVPGLMLIGPMMAAQMDKMGEDTISEMMLKFSKHLDTIPERTDCDCDKCKARRK